MQFHLESLLSDLRKRRPERAGRFAAFNADGTLWDTDLGEALFNHQIKYKLVPCRAIRGRIIIAA